LRNLRNVSEIVQNATDNFRILTLVNSHRLRKKVSNLYYGWRMIGLVSALRVLGGGLHQYGFTVFFLPVTQDLGLTRAATSLAFSLARTEGSLAAPIVGYFIDRFGPKPMMLIAASMAGIGYILFSWVDSYTTFLVFTFCSAGSPTSSTSQG